MAVTGACPPRVSANPTSACAAAIGYARSGASRAASALVARSRGRSAKIATGSLTARRDPASARRTATLIGQS